MKYAFITPRYGGDIGAGAEHACRLLAERIGKRHDVDVLTTTARNPVTWNNEYSEGADRIRGVLVRRFSVSSVGDRAVRDELGRRLREQPHSRADEIAWVGHLGPSSTGLIEFLKRQHRSYDALVFFGLLHPLTVSGLEIAPERSILFPYLQLRPELRFDLCADRLSLPRALGLFSSAERRLVHAFIGVAPHHEEIVGIGIDAPPPQSYPRLQQDPADVITHEDEDTDSDEPSEDGYLSGRGVLFRRRHRLYSRFVLYGGRVESDNGCEEMLEYFDTYAASGDGTALVLMGVKMIKVSDAPYLRLAGVLPESDRMTAYEAAAVTIAPGPDDLLAQSLLESMAVGTPVLASARNEAAVEHCRRANGGLYYANRDEFVGAMTELMRNAQLRERMGDNGRRYVRQSCEWDGVIGRFERLVSRVKAR